MIKKEMKSPSQVTIEIKNLSNEYVVMRKKYNELRHRGVRDEEIEDSMDSLDCIISTLSIFLHTGVLVDGMLFDIYDFYEPTSKF